MNRILVAYDGSEPAHRALERGAELAEAFGAELGVVSVTPWRGGSVPADVSDDAKVHARALKSASDWLRRRGLSATLLSPTGDPGETIETVAEAGDFDTISLELAAWVRSVASCREASPSTWPPMPRRRSSLPADRWIRTLGVERLRVTPSSNDQRGDSYMSKRPSRAQVVHRLVSPVRITVRNPIPRLRRSFSPQRPRWSVARWTGLRRGVEPRPRDGGKT